MRHVTSVIRTATLLLTVAAAAYAGDAEWTSAGPLGGRVHEIIFDPTDPSLGYATTYGGVFRSTDGGETWGDAGAGIVADSTYPLPLALDADQPSDLYTFDSWSRIYRSSNRGENWAILPESLPSNVHPSTIVDVPGASCALLLGTATDVASTGPMLFASNDCGLSFEQIGAGLPPEVAVKAIAFDPGDLTHNTIFVGLDGDSGAEGNAVWRSSDGGLNFTPLPSNFSPGDGYRLEVTRLSFGPAGDIWALVGSYLVFHSNDGGATWRDTGVNGAGTVIADRAVAGRAWAGGGIGVARIDYSAPSYSISPFADGLTPNTTYSGGSGPILAGVARLAWRGGATPRLFATTEGAGIYKFGAGLPGTWSPVDRPPAGAAIRALAIHPQQPQKIWAGQATFSVSSPALYTTTNGAATWAPSNVGLAAADIQAIVIDTTTTSDQFGTKVYAGGRASNSFGDDYRNHALFRSDTSGQNWLSLEGNLPSVTNHELGAIRGLALDPRPCVTPPCLLGESGGLNRLYAVGFGRTSYMFELPNANYRVMRSDDRGSNWTALDGNLSGFPPSTLSFDGGRPDVEQRVTPTVVVVDPANVDTVFVGTESFFFDYDTGDSTEIDVFRASGLFRSTNAGANWQRITNLPPKLDDHGDASYPNASLDVVDFLIDPTNTNVFWIALYDPTRSRTSTILRSSNRGFTWQSADDGIHASLELRDLAFDPQDSNVLYAAAGGNGANPGAVYRGVYDTNTQSMRWLSISVGLPAESAYVVEVDPADPDLIYAGTDTGVHTIRRQPDQDGDGVPDAVEGLAPDVGGLPSGDGNGDFTPDAAQRDVGTSVIVIRGTTGGTAVTSAIVSGTGPGASFCTQAVDVAAIAVSELAIDLDPATNQVVRHPLPARQFDIGECATAVVDITYHGADFSAPGWRFRYFGPSDAGEQDSIGWHDLPGATRVNPSTWRVTLAADSLGSYRPEVDTIRFVGAPGCFDDRLFGDSLEDTPTIMPSCAP